MRPVTATCLALAAFAFSACGEDIVTSDTTVTPAKTAVVNSQTTSAASTTASSQCPTAKNPQNGPDNFSAPVTLTAANGLQQGDFVVGDGAVAKSGSNVTVQYTGWLTADGTQFDSSRKPGAHPFQVVIGQGKVIQGWDLGIPGMKVGGKRRLVIPASLGYGASGQPPTIPANASLTFDVELLSAC